MNRRRFVLFLIVGLLTFLMGVTAAVVLGGFDPLERFSRRSGRHLTIPPQPLGSSGCKTTANKKDYHYRYTQPRTADLRYPDKSLTPPPSKVGPSEPNAYFEEESERLRPSTPSARR